MVSPSATSSWMRNVRANGVLRFRADNFTLKQALSGSRVQGNKIEALGDWITAATDPSAAWNASLADLDNLAELDAERDGTERRPETLALSTAGFNTGDLDRIARSLKPEAWRPCITGSRKRSL